MGGLNFVGGGVLEWRFMVGEVLVYIFLEVFVFEGLVFYVSWIWSWMKDCVDVFEIYFYWCCSVGVVLVVRCVYWWDCWYWSGELYLIYFRRVL